MTPMFVRDDETPAYYDEFAAGYETARRPNDATGYHAMLDDLEVGLVERYGRGKTVLEVGAGTGPLARAHRELRVGRAGRRSLARHAGKSRRTWPVRVRGLRHGAALRRRTVRRHVLVQGARPRAGHRPGSVGDGARHQARRRRAGRVLQPVLLPRPGQALRSPPARSRAARRKVRSTRASIPRGACRRSCRRAARSKAGAASASSPPRPPSGRCRDSATCSVRSRSPWPTRARRTWPVSPSPSSASPDAEAPASGLYSRAMSFWFKTTRYLLPVMAFGAASYMAVRFDGTALWHGLDTVSSASAAGRDYDLTQLRVASDVVKLIRDKYVDPKRVKPREMLLSALNYIQRDVAQVIVVHEENAPTLKIRIDTQEEKEFRVDTVVGPWDLTARLQEIFSFIQQNLKGTEVDLREVEYAACNGMLHTLDPHSVLLSPEAATDMSTSTKGQFGGLGIVISIRDQELTVMSPMPGTPAGRAGLKRLDRITRINNESTLNMGLQEALEHLRGTPGSKVTIWIRRDGESGWKEPKPFELAREVIKVKSVESKALDGNVGYVRLKQFQQTTTAELDAALAELKKGGELKGLVLDLRGNPGGLLDQAARVVDRFVNEGAHRRDRRQPPRRSRRKGRPQRRHRAELPDRALGLGQLRFRQRDRRGRTEKPRPRRARRRDHLRQGLRAARLRRDARQGGPQAHHRAVPHRAGRHLDPGDRRHARHRAGPDDRRPARDGPQRRLVRSARTRPVEKLVECTHSRRAKATRSRPVQFLRERPPGVPRPRRRARRQLRDGFSDPLRPRSHRAFAARHPPRPAEGRQGFREPGAHRRARQGLARSPGVRHRLERRTRPRGRSRRRAQGGRGRRQGRDRPPRQHGQRGRSDPAQDLRHQQGQGAALPFVGHHQERQRALRQEGARHRQARAGQDQGRHRAARLL